MTPEERLIENARKLIRQGCSVDEAVNQAAQGSTLANKADKLREIKLQIEWEMKFG